MSKKVDQGKKGGAAAPPSPSPAVPERAEKLPPLYRSVDWLTALLAALLVFIGYYLTLAPDLTLEDSGELAVASMYAGVPHPPGYPVWTAYTWVFTKLVPFSNIAWRVALASAVAGAVACGLLGLMVSRGSSMMVESIPGLKEISRRLENTICVISGVVASLLLAFNGFMWSQAIIVEVYTMSHLSLVATLCCLLHYIYNPHQKRYLYLTFFFFGICFANHQSLLLAAVGLEVTILARRPAFGRYLFLGNSLIYTLILTQKAMGGRESLDSNPPLFLVFNFIGILSLYVYLWYSLRAARTTKWITLGIHLLINVVAWIAFVKAFESAPSSKLAVDASKSYALFVLLFNPLLIFGAYLFSLLVGTGEKSFHTSAEWRMVGTAVGMGAMWILGAATYFFMPIASMANPPMNWAYPRLWEGFTHALSRGQYEKTNPCDFITDIDRFLGQLWLYFSGTTDEFNPVYLAFLIVPFLFLRRMQQRERSWMIGITAIWGGLGVLLLIMLNPNLDRQSRDLVRVFFTSSYVLLALGIGYGITILMAALATQFERYRRAAMWCGGAAIVLALYSVLKTYPATNEFLNGGYDMLMSLLRHLFIGPLKPFAPGMDGSVGEPSYYFLNRFVVWYGLALAVLATLMVLISRKRVPMTGLLALIALMPVYQIVSNWSDNEQRGHMFGYWFGHDMFTPPFTGPDGELSYDAALRAEMMRDPERAKLIYPEMARDAVLFGGTDPGRFCPTYMIFCESFIAPEHKKNTDPAFDRRDVYIITQNALADGTYLNYIRAHYNRSAQIDAPFFREMFRSLLKDKPYETNLLARAVGPLDRFFLNLGDQIERDRRAGSSMFDEGDFKDLPGLVAKLQPGPEQHPLAKFIHERLSENTRALLSGGASPQLADALARDLNRIIEAESLQIRKLQELGRRKRALEADYRNPDRAAIQRIEEEMNDLESIETLYTPEKFAGITLSEDLKRFLRENPQDWSRIRMNRQLFEAAYPDEITVSPGGLYPDREIITPTHEDSQRCFQQYVLDVERRERVGQLKQGEVVNRTPDGRVQVAGQVAVMSINGLLTKVIFDKNPHHEFYVEESFPLDWMYPHLTPYGIIMKINREPLPELTDEIVRRDHEFWSRFSDRLIGNWITYDTPVQEVADFAERVYLRRDYAGFTGDRKFIRDDQAQKSFSKLRSSIGGVYAWRLQEVNKRLQQQRSPEEQQRLFAEQQRMFREAEFSFKQAFAFCPYSPEAVYRYINVLAGQLRYDDALIIAETCLKLDPFNTQVESVVEQLRGWKQQQGQVEQMQQSLANSETELRANPSNFTNAFSLAMTYFQMGQTPRGEAILDGIVTNPNSPPEAVLSAAHLYSQFGNFPKLEQALERMVTMQPENPEAWYDLAALRANIGQGAEALAALRKAIDLSNQRLAREPGARNLKEGARTDDRFTQIRGLPEFQELVGAR